jgi:hypothetical protein
MMSTAENDKDDAGDVEENRNEADLVQDSESYESVTSMMLKVFVTIGSRLC